MMNTSFSWAQFECSFTRHKMMMMILGLLAVLLVPLPSLTEGKKAKGLCFVTIQYERPKVRPCRPF